MARSDMKIIGIIEHPQCGKYLIVVEKRFSLAHDNNIAHALVEVSLHVSDLLDDFRGGEVPRESLSACGTEGAGHRASHLGGNTNSQSLYCPVTAVQGHADRLHQPSVVKFKDVLSRAIA